MAFIPIPKKGNAKECSNYRTIALISHASKGMLKIGVRKYENESIFPKICKTTFICSDKITKWLAPKALSALF